MDEKYITLFKSLDLKEAPHGLKGEIMVMIKKEEKARESRKVFAFAIGTLSSVYVLFALGSSLVQSLTHSGFSNYMSLVLSFDAGVLTYWKELSYSLVESLPVFGVVSFLLGVSVFVWTSSNTMASVKRFHLLTN